MNEKKNKIFELTKMLKEKLEVSNEETFYEICEGLLHDIQDVVNEINNDQITQKFNGIYSDFIGTKTTTKDKVLEHIEIFEEVVEKNLEIENLDNISDKLNKEDEKSKVYETIEKYKYAIMCRDAVTLSECQYDLIQYALSLPNEETKKVNEVLNPLTALFANKELSTFTEKDEKEALKMIEDLEKTIELTKVKVENEEKQVPESIEAIKEEMDSIIGVSLLNEIENIDLKEEKYEILSEEDKEKLSKLKDEIKEYQFSLEPNKKEIEKLRLEMYLLLGPDLFNPYETHKETVALLDDSKKERFEKLKEEYNKKVSKELSERKSKTTKDDNKVESEFTEKEQNFINNDKFLDKKIQKIREEMAVLIYGKDMEHKAYEGIENINVDHPNSNLESEEEKDRFRELQQEILPLLAKKAKRTKRKGKLVKFKKSAKEFYKKHKKAIWFAAGIAILAVSITSLLPSIMYLNSALWHTAMTAGASAEVGLPVVLHDINTIIGSNIGAKFATDTGIWTLANGAALNATAAEAGILSTLGRIALIATPFVGAKIAIKNACKLAKEKIQKRKEKIEKETPERKGHFFKNIKDYAKNKFNAIKETATTKYNAAKENVNNKYNEIKENHEKKQEEKALKKENHFKSKTTSSMLEEAYNLGLIDEEQLEKYLEADTEETIEFIKNGFKEEKGKGSK